MKSSNTIIGIERVGSSLREIERYLSTKPVIIFLGDSPSTLSPQSQGFKFFVTAESEKNSRKEPLFIGYNGGACGLLTYSSKEKEATFVHRGFLDDFLSNPLAIYLSQEIKWEENGFSHLQPMLISFGNYLLSRYHQSENITEPDRMQLSSYKLKAIDNYLAFSIDKKVTTKDLARISDLSLYHFTRVFKQRTGFTPGRYIRKFKMVKAKQLLIENHLPIIQIGFEVGFVNPSHFTRVFKGVFGMTPREFQMLMPSKGNENADGESFEQSKLQVV